jgi:transposase
VVADHLDDARLEGLYRIGMDEVSYRNGHRYLTVVADHDRDGAVVWAGEGKSGASLERCFDTWAPSAPPSWPRPRWTGMAPPPRSPGPVAPPPGCAPTPSIIKLANAAVDEVRRAAWNTTRRAAGVPARDRWAASARTPLPSWSTTPAGRC